MAAGLLTYGIVRRHGTAVQALFALGLLLGAILCMNQAYQARPYGLLIAFTALTFDSWQRAALREHHRLWPLCDWWYNIAMGFDMLIGRFLMIIPALALAGNLAQKKSVPPSPGTFPVNTPLFTVLLIGVVIIVGALTFFPALSLGPILEHLLLHAGRVF